jgi:ThiF family
MSQQLISLNPELKRLRDEGHNVRIEAGHLVIAGIPYVANDRSTKTGILVTDLVVSADVVSGMGTHVIHFAGDYPCDQHGAPLAKIKNVSDRKEIVPGIIIEHSFSSKPAGGKPYADYYDKVTTYVEMISAPAIELDSSLTPRMFPPLETGSDESPFQYVDTATSRAGIGAISSKLELDAIAIIGLGGTGSYVLDFVAKTPVKGIHLFDEDVFSNHNAFRAPGAASIEELRDRPKKVDYLLEKYSKMHRHIHAYPYRMDGKAIEELLSMSFVFICIDDGPAKKAILRALKAAKIPFIDVGMGLNVSPDGKLFGAVRVVTWTPESDGRFDMDKRISYGEAPDGALYATNIQVAELNCMNACMAVIRWKKYLGFYADLEEEHFSCYNVDGNNIVNDDQNEDGPP